MNDNLTTNYNIINLFFTLLTHPLSMGLTLMINTTITSLMIATLSESPWFSYVLFMEFLGGVLLLFTYVTSLAQVKCFTSTLK